MICGIMGPRDLLELHIVSGYLVFVLGILHAFPSAVAQVLLVMEDTVISKHLFVTSFPRNGGTTQ